MNTPQPPSPNPDAFEVEVTDMAKKETDSQAIARLVTDGTTSALTLKTYAGAGEGLGVNDLVKAMKKAGDEAVAGNLARTERMLANQLLTLNAMFDNLAQRAHRQTDFKAIETMTRLALKAQAQARATAETLAVIKNPMPYIKQANIAQGHQQVNNGTQPTHAGNFQTKPNELLETQHGERMDTRAATAASPRYQAVEAVEPVNRPNKRRGQGKVKS